MFLLISKNSISFYKYLHFATPLLTSAAQFTNVASGKTSVSCGGTLFSIFKCPKTEIVSK